MQEYAGKSITLPNVVQSNERKFNSQWEVTTGLWKISYGPMWNEPLILEFNSCPLQNLLPTMQYPSALVSLPFI